MSDYKNTLNLPETDFPMKANLAEREKETLAFWDSLDLYQRLRKQGEGRPPFILHDGPPYANGPIHLGTSLNKTLKDIVIKSKTLSGFNAPFVPGWDCHGLPIELNVEKKIGKPGQKVSSDVFRKACRNFAASQVDLQRNDFKRLGVIGDWNNPYFTMHYGYEAETIRSLAKMIENGHLHRGQKPVHWCTDCGSALAEAEVEYKDKVSLAIDVAFEAVNPSEVLSAFHCSEQVASVVVPIWTTTPWTLPANQAVCLNPKLDYVLVSCNLNKRSWVLVLAKDLIDDIMARYQVSHYHVLAESKGETLAHIKLKHPYLDRIVPIVLGDHVTTDTGTGNVHTAPAHGQDDYIMGERYGLPMDNPVDARSCFVEGTLLVAGLHVTKANDPIIEKITEMGHLLHLATLEHSYPHCWRHKTPLIFRATPQWFISMDQKGLRAMGLHAISQVHWIPDWGQNRLYKMVESRPDWCISRQRAWGIPIPLFVHKETNELHPKTIELMHKAADVVEQGGVDAWFDHDVKDFIDPGEAEHYFKSSDVLDVWFDSGVSHTCVLEKRPELSTPADLYLEGSDQHRGWFQTSLLTSIAIRNAAPYKTVLTHGYVVDGKGMKMSKSLGNTVAPSEVVQKYGADILRLWVASSYFIDDIRFSDEIIKHVVDAYRRIRNTARFLLSNLYDFDPKKDIVDASALVALDAWAIQTTIDFQQRILEAYDQYRFQSIYQMIHHFCAIEMGSFYLDIIKDRQYTSKKDGIPRRSSQTAMYYILEALVRWLAPILSFTSEEIWKYMPGAREESVFLSNWFKNFPVFEKNSEALDWEWLIQVRDAVNKVLEKHRKEGNIRSALDAKVVLYASDDALVSLVKMSDELRFLLITSDANVEEIKNKPASAEATDMAELFVDVIVSSYEKCERCWQRRIEVGKSSQHPTLCQRCEDNVFGAGENRKYA